RGEQEKMGPAMPAAIRRHPVLTLTLAALLLGTVAAAWVWAHEGHAALPTQGVTVQAERVLVVLTPTALDALCPTTESVAAGGLAERLAAPATVAAPWSQHAYAATRIGGKVAAVSAQPGQAVVQGRTLAEVQSLDLENLQLDLLTARTAEQLSANNLKDL